MWFCALVSLARILWFNKVKNLLKIVLLAVSLSVVSFSVFAHIDAVELKNVSIKDAAHIMAKMSRSNISVTNEVAQLKLDLSLRNVSLRHAIETLSRITGVWYRFDKRNNSYLLMTEKQYQSSIVVYRDDIIRSFTLKHQNVKAAALTIQGLFGDRVVLNLQEDLDDFQGIPSSLLSSHTDSSGGSRITLTRSDESGKINQDVITLERKKISSDVLSNSEAFEQIEFNKLKQLGDLSRIDADKEGKNIGLRTPIFITVNRIHNLMFVRTSDESALADIAKLIEVSDKPTPQVLLEMKIIKIDDGEGFEQGIDLGFDDAFNVEGMSYESGSTTGHIRSGAAELEFGNGLGISSVMRSLSQIAGGSVTRLGLSALEGGFYEFYSKYINARIDFLESHQVAEIVAKPILLASNNRPARLFIGEDQVVATGMDGGGIVQVDNGNTTSTTSTDTTLDTEVKKIGSTLVLLPSVNEDRTVTIDIFQSTSSLKRKGMDFPFYNSATRQIESIKLDTIEESSVKTIVVAKDGHTIALGGMTNMSDRNDYSTVPLLGDVPILGELFKTKSEAAFKGQYIMLITPHIIMTPEEGAIRSREIEEIDFKKHSDDSLIIGVNNAKRGQPLVSELIDLSRYAVKKKHGLNIESEQGVTRLYISSDPVTGLVDNDKILFIPQSAYKKGGLYLTHVESLNASGESKSLNLALVKGDWLAISKQQLYLAPNSPRIEGHDDLYFVSNEPFEDIIKALSK